MIKKLLGGFVIVKILLVTLLEKILKVYKNTV